MESRARNIFLEFQRTCETTPAKTCLKYKRADAWQSVTYSRLYQDVCRLRRLLREAGITPGSRAAILLGNGPLWPTAFFAVVSLQGVAVPIDAQLGPEEIERILRHSASKLLLTEDKFAVAWDKISVGNACPRAIFLDRADAFSQEADAEETIFSYPDSKLAALFYTSGTTDTQKAVMLTHRNLLTNFDALKKLRVFREDDIVLSLLPLHHTYPFMATCLLPLLQGAGVCYLSSLIPQELFACFKENGVTVFVGVPQLFSMIDHSISGRFKKYGALPDWGVARFLDACAGLRAACGVNLNKAVLKKLHDAFGGRLRLLASGGAKLDPGVASRLWRLGFAVAEGYGLTETSPVVALNLARVDKFDSVGIPLDGVDVKIVRADERGLGEIAVRGGNVMLGYYRALPLTKRVIRDGWFLTGDLGFRDSEGYLHIGGRVNDLIVLPSGKKINPEIVEAHYAKIPYIQEICVFYASSGSEEGHLVAVIVPDEERLRREQYVDIHFKIRWELDASSQKLPSYQRIHGFVLTQGPLPRTRLGKVVRYRIRQMYTSGMFKDKTVPAPKQLSHFQEMALQYLSRMLKKPVQLQDHLELDLGLDSLGRIELLSALQSLVNVGIDDALALELFQARTVEELIQKAQQALPENAFAKLLRDEELVFWPHWLKEPPSEEDKARIKLTFDAAERAASLVVVGFLKLLTRVLFFLGVRGGTHIPRKGPFIVTPNHVGYLDALFVVCALPWRLFSETYFVGFGAIFRHPLVAWAARFFRLIPIDADVNLAQTLRVCRWLLDQGKVLVYFPEGQRSADGEIKPFRKGIGILAQESGVPILPVYLDGAFRVWPRTRPFPRPAHIVVKIGPCESPKAPASTAPADIYEAVAEILRRRVTALKTHNLF